MNTLALLHDRVLGFAPKLPTSPPAPPTKSTLPAWEQERLSASVDDSRNGSSLSSVLPESPADEHDLADQTANSVGMFADANKICVACRASESEKKKYEARIAQLEEEVKKLRQEKEDWVEWGIRQEEEKKHTRSYIDILKDKMEEAAMSVIRLNLAMAKEPEPKKLPEPQKFMSIDQYLAAASERYTEGVKARRRQERRQKRDRQPSPSSEAGSQ